MRQRPCPRPRKPSARSIRTSLASVNARTPSARSRTLGRIPSLRSGRACRAPRLTPFGATGPRPYSPPGLHRNWTTHLPSRFTRSLRSLVHPSHGAVSVPPSRSAPSTARANRTWSAGSECRGPDGPRPHDLGEGRARARTRSTSWRTESVTLAHGDQWERRRRAGPIRGPPGPRISRSATASEVRTFPMPSTDQETVTKRTLPVARRPRQPGA